MTFKIAQYDSVSAWLNPKPQTRASARILSVSLLAAAIACPAAQLDAQTPEQQECTFEFVRDGDKLVPTTKSKGCTSTGLAVIAGDVVTISVPELKDSEVTAKCKPKPSVRKPLPSAKTRTKPIPADFATNITLANTDLGSVPRPESRTLSLVVPHDGTLSVQPFDTGPTRTLLEESGRSVCGGLQMLGAPTITAWFERSNAKLKVTRCRPRGKSGPCTVE
jgi:hypothetical protein